MPPTAGPSPGVSAPVPVAASGVPGVGPSSGPPPIVLEDSDSDEGVQTLAVPFRSGSSDTYLPMLSTDDSWSTDPEFRYYKPFAPFLPSSSIS